jgi:hypothetical protein
MSLVSDDEGPRSCAFSKSIWLIFSGPNFGSSVREFRESLRNSKNTDIGLNLEQFPDPSHPLTAAGSCCGGGERAWVTCAAHTARHGWLGRFKRSREQLSISCYEILRSSPHSCKPRLCRSHSCQGPSRRRHLLKLHLRKGKNPSNSGSEAIRRRLVRARTFQELHFRSQLLLHNRQLHH